MTFVADAASALLVFPVNTRRAGHLRPVPFQAQSSPISLAELFPGPRKYGPEPGKAAKARQLMPLEWFSMDEQQELVDKPSSSFLTLQSSESEGWLCLSEGLQQDGARTAHSTTCPSVHTLLSLVTHHSHTVPHPHPRRPLSKLPTPPPACLGLLWGESKTGELVDFTNSYIFKDIFILPLPWRASWLGIEFLFHHGTIISNYCY